MKALCTWKARYPDEASKTRGRQDSLTLASRFPLLRGIILSMNANFNSSSDLPRIIRRLVLTATGRLYDLRPELRPRLDRHVPLFKPRPGRLFTPFSTSTTSSWKPTSRTKTRSPIVQDQTDLPEASNWCREYARIYS